MTTGSSIIQSLTLLTAKTWGKFGYSKSFAPGIQHLAWSISFTTENRKFMFSWSRKVTTEELCKYMPETRAIVSGYDDF